MPLGRHIAAFVAAHLAAGASADCGLNSEGKSTIQCTLAKPYAQMALPGGPCTPTSPLCCPPEDCAQAAGATPAFESCDPSDPDCIPPPQYSGGGGMPPVPAGVTYLVSGGGFAPPYYTFEPPLAPLQPGETYTFRADGISAAHPFRIGPARGEDLPASLRPAGRSTG
jgi:hypothetical protein